MPLCAQFGKRPIPRARCCSTITLILFLALSSCAMDLQPSGTDQPFSLAAVEHICRLPAPCGQPLQCEGRQVRVWGYADSANIISKSRFPETASEKFRLLDRRGRAIEIWAKAADNQGIFEKLARRPSDRIVVTGELSTFDMPITIGCQKGIKLFIHDASQIAFN